MSVLARVSWGRSEPYKSFKTPLPPPFFQQKIAICYLAWVNSQFMQYPVAQPLHLLLVKISRDFRLFSLPPPPPIPQNNDQWGSFKLETTWTDKAGADKWNSTLNLIEQSDDISFLKVQTSAWFRFVGKHILTHFLFMKQAVQVMSHEEHNLHVQASSPTNLLFLIPCLGNEKRIKNCYAI
jgi:hypothetical protein